MTMNVSGLNIDVGSVLTGVGQLAKDIREAITGELSPEKQADILSKAQELEAAAAQAQTTINLEEAKSDSLFKSGWRPACGWLGVMGLMYTFFVQPLLAWASLNFEWIAPPTIDSTVLLNLLFAILGLGAYRSYEKVKMTTK
jgi:hypothetical protein